jgi:ornithine decarboxylase
VIKCGGPEGIKEFAMDVIRKHKLDDTLYVYDLGNVARMYHAWTTALPRVKPFYAIKCNPEMNVIRLLASLGAGFDCASKGEIDRVLSTGVHPDSIVFAHPCKPTRDILHASERGVELTTFDTESELEKISHHNPRMNCILRIRADDPDARVPLGLKYGADMDEVPNLLRASKKFGLRVSGVSFHVGSASKNPDTFRCAIESARTVFDMASDLGIRMNLLDIGGGFTGRFNGVAFGEISNTINGALDRSFPDKDVRIIAEPGRYFAETAATLFCPVSGRRDRTDGHKDYFLTDGLYGSFNCILYDGQTPEFSVMRSPFLEDVNDDYAVTYPSTIWGPTCDSADVLFKGVRLPQLRNQDWLMFPNAGAYTVAGACDFNGIAMTKPNVFHVVSESPL